MRRIIVILALVGLAGCAFIRSLTGPPPAYPVFFDDKAILLTPDGRTIVDQAAADAKAHPGRTVEISGPSTKAATGYDPALAETRIHLVEQTLIDDGIAKDRLVRAVEPTVIKAGKTDQQRVDIRLIEKPVH
jgi:outer membrane protein OmpA-like peptidoglycan-associated protein